MQGGKKEKTFVAALTERRSEAESKLENPRHRNPLINGPERILKRGGRTPKSMRKREAETKGASHTTSCIPPEVTSRYAKETFRTS